ncbi:TonB-dependent receptor domain-containing protein [Croceiramulus getboli]|nr:TonB-dependent receptor [Flavobacteriaceae bacterium YJPT1-3]
MKYSLLLLCTLFFSLSGLAQDTGSIVGVLSDKEANNAPLPFATVQIKDTSKGSTTDFDGLYELANIDPGTYTLIFSFVGYETLEVPDVVVESGKVTTVNTGLSASAAALDEVIIKTTVSRESEVALLLEQKKAVSIQQSIGADELARKGVSDAAAAIAKISGVSQQQGGGNVYVRGLGDRYLNTTYNGLSLPSNDIENKNIDLDLFPSDIIQNVNVSKAYATNFYGDFAAGNINVVSKDYKGRGFLTADLGTGFNTNALGLDQNLRSEGTGYFGFYNRYHNNPFAIILSHGPDPVDAGAPINVSGSLAGGTSFDFGEDGGRLSAFGTVSFANDFGYRRGQASDYTTVFEQEFSDVEWYDYNTTTTAMANLIYRNGDHQLQFNSLFLNSTSDEISNFGIDGQGRNRDAIVNTDGGFFVKNIQFQQDMIFVNQLSGLHQFDENLELSWGVGFNTALSRQPDRKRFTLEQYDLELDNDPVTAPTFFSNTDFDNQRYFQDIRDEELNSRVNLEYTASETVKYNFGYNGRTKERNFENIRYGYDLLARNTPVPNINNLNDIFTVENLGVIYETSVIRPIAPELGIGTTNFPGLPENTYTGNLDIHGIYANAELTAGKWLFVPGMRVEFFEQSINYDVINLVNGIGDVAVYDNFYLPSLNIKYALNDDQNLRLSASKTVSIPEFKEVAPFVYENVVTRVGGNPNVLSETSTSDIFNLDLKYEWFMEGGQLLSLAAFAKEIKDPINKVIANDATGTQRYFRTGEKANVYGLELEVRKNLLTDENGDANLAFGLNATYMHTEQDLNSEFANQGPVSITTTINRTDELQGASPFLINADLNYSPTQFENYKPVANLIFSYFGDRIDVIGPDQLGNIVEKSVATLDFVLRNSIGEHWEVNFSAKNLLNPDIEFLRENTPDGDVPIIKFQRGVNFGLSAKYKF